MAKLLAVVDGARVEIDGRDVLIILTPYHPPFENVEQVGKQLCDLFNKGGVVYARKDGERMNYELSSAGPVAEKIRALEPLPWTRIEIYPAP